MSKNREVEKMMIVSDKGGRGCILKFSDAFLNFDVCKCMVPGERLTKLTETT